MDHEIRRGDKLIETLRWELGRPWSFEDRESETYRETLRQHAVLRAFELKALAYERRNPHWLESDHYRFECREIDENTVAITTPVGICRLAARRVRKGEITTSVSVGATAIGYGTVAREDQTSPPVAIHGRLCPPEYYDRTWHFQPSAFEYQDGTFSAYLGSYPREIAWETEPAW